MLNNNKVAVISTGNGGQSMAAYFAHYGFMVSLYAREEERIVMFPEDRVFRLRGIVEGDPAVACISSDMSEVIQDAFLIMVTTPTQYHEVIAREMAPHLTDGQIVVLNPGRTFGTYVFTKTLADHNCSAAAIIAEAETFVFACRCTRTAEPVIHGIKEHVRVAAHHPADTPIVLTALERVFPGTFEPAGSIFETSFSNIGMVFHPLPILLNITRVEAQEKFLYYMQGITPLVANILDRMDSERMSVARAFGVSVDSAYDWLQVHYGAQGDNLYERIQNTSAYANIYAPIDIDTRYVYEDMMTGCVPIYYAGQVAGIDTPIIRSAILWASTVYGTDFIHNGRNNHKIDFVQLYKDANS